jgi:hypothetical protein
LLGSKMLDVTSWSSHVDHQGIIRKDVLEKKGRQVHTIQYNELHYLLDLAASTYDTERTMSRPGSATRKLIRDIVQSEAFKLGRLRIAAHMRPRQ